MGLHIGTSGWSYPSWRPGFYPAGMAPDSFLDYYAGRFDTVELNTTGYRIPSEAQFRRWADAVPDGFRFAPKLAPRSLAGLTRLAARFGALGDRLGPLRVVVSQPRDDELLASVLAALDPGLELALDFRDDSWSGVTGVVAVNDLEAEPFRYLRLRDPPYTDDQLQELALALRPPAYVYFRHEDEPSAPAYARRLGELVRVAPPPARPGG